MEISELISLYEHCIIDLQEARALLGMWCGDSDLVEPILFSKDTDNCFSDEDKAPKTKEPIVEGSFVFSDLDMHGLKKSYLKEEELGDTSNDIAQELDINDFSEKDLDTLIDCLGDNEHLIQSGVDDSLWKISKIGLT